MDRLESYVKVVSFLEDTDPKEEMQKITGKEETNYESTCISSEDIINSLSLEKDSEVVNYDFPAVFEDLSTIFTQLEDLMDENRSYTSSSLPSYFEITGEGNDFRRFDETGFKSVAEYDDGSSLSVEYGEKTSFGFGGSETAKIRLQVEGEYDLDFVETWDLR